MTEPRLLSPTCLFRYSVDCPYQEKLWPVRGAPALGPDALLPSFGELESRRLFAQLFLAWNERGLGVFLQVSGKSKGVWCRDTRAEDSDGLSLWIDTRDSHQVHRASRFCHRFTLLPAGRGDRAEQPVAFLLPINRARELPKPVSPGTIQVESRLLPDGYRLSAFIPADALTGYDPAEHPRLGFSYAVIDREMGWQVLSLGPEYPFMEDPSLWGTLELRRPESGSR